MLPWATGRVVVVLLSWVGLCAGCAPGCKPQPGPEPPRQDHGPVGQLVAGPLGSPGRWATAEQLETFARGKQVAEHRFDLRSGLGPSFNVTFCAACHERPVTGGGSALYRNFFLTGVLNSDGVFMPGTSAGPSGGVIRMYHYSADGPARPPVPQETNVITQRNAIPFFGVGLLAAVPESEILALADPDDANGDGISGRPNHDRGFVGRFGLKAQTVSIEGFIRGPLFNHLGITTDPLTEEQKAALPVDSSSSGVTGALNLLGRALTALAQAAAPAAPLTDDDGVADPEMSTADLFDLVSFAMLLSAPQPEPLTEQTRRGLMTFDRVGCADCHAPRLTGPQGPLPVYSDLLLHDMGPALADGIRQGEATGSEFRTQPLWGLSAVGPYLHDGRATTVHQAISMHAGEGTGARDRYLALSEDEQADLQEFLLSLGGRTQVSGGLVPLNAPVAAVGSYGGPQRQLTDEERADFESGLRLFDQDMGLNVGVGGPRLNGDSCRACHFDPVVGGAGPRGVNVMRHGIMNSSGQFVPPAVGTVLHKSTVLRDSVNRPQPEANVFEHRQTPSLLGLGLLDAVSESTLEAMADPNDADMDGISGRVSYTDGGRVGRFGWKAQVPSLAEFARDALSTEMGLTMLPETGMTFGKLQDNDEYPDPEISLGDVHTLTRFLKMLGAPPRQPVADTAKAARGQQLMDQVRCTACHVPTLSTPLGDANAYSDLLLHEILPPGAAGIEEASANVREFRTAPLWGISTTAPYLHSGTADTLAQAIAGHDGEAVASRQAFAALSTQEQEDLIYFLESL